MADHFHAWARSPGGRSFVLLPRPFPTRQACDWWIRNVWRLGKETRREARPQPRPDHDVMIRKCSGCPPASNGRPAGRLDTATARVLSKVLGVAVSGAALRRARRLARATLAESQGGLP